MRVVSTILLVCSLGSGIATAQSGHCDSDGYGYPNTGLAEWHGGPSLNYAPPGVHCDTPPSAAQGPPYCGCARCQEQQQHIYVCPHCQGGEPENYPGEPENEPSPPVAAPEGAFVAPPRSGVEQEAGQSFGIGGLGLRFPEMRLQLPSIELPRIMRFRHSRQMQLDHGTAPFVVSAPQREAAPMMQMPMPAPMAAMQVAAAPMPLTSFSAARTERAPAKQSEAAPESESTPESAPGTTEADVAELCKRVDGLQQLLRQRQLELQRQMQELNDCMSRLNQGTAVPLPVSRGYARPVPKAAPCNCPKCQAARQPKPYCDSPSPAFQFQGLPRRAAPNAATTDQPEPIPLPVPPRYPSPLPTPPEPVTPEDPDRDNEASVSVPSRLSDLPAESPVNTQGSSDDVVDSTSAVLRLPRAE